MKKRDLIVISSTIAVVLLISLACFAAWSIIGLRERVSELSAQAKIPTSPIIQLSQEKEVASSAGEKTLVPTSSSSGASPKTLVISDVLVDVTAYLVKITWTTSVASQSQLLLDTGSGLNSGNGYESMNGIGTKHEINFRKPVAGVTYRFEILAHTTDGKLSNNYYSSFTGVGPYRAFMDPYGTGCREIHIVDSEGVSVSSFPVNISGSYKKGGATYDIPYSTESTDARGVISTWVGCGQFIKSLSISGRNLNVTLHD